MTLPIKSYVLRAGRISKIQQEGIDLWLQQYTLPREICWNFKDIFKRAAPCVLEIGFGMGDALLEMAQRNPDHNYIGVEVHRPGVGRLATQVNEHKLTNVRIVMDDVWQVLNNNIPDAALSGIHIFFPDPWPKKRHHKRRLIQPEFIRLAVQKLNQGGYIHCATDWEEYAHHMLAVLMGAANLRNTSSDTFTPRPPERPYTKFEKRGARLGHTIYDLIFTKS